MKADGSAVLLVDDDPIMRRLLERILARGRYTVMSAEDGEKGLEMARAHSPALVILDVVMPVMDGYAVCQALQEDPFTSHIPVLMLTGLSGQRQVIRGLNGGADDYVVKPFHVNELMARIKNLILRSRNFVYASNRRLLPQAS